MQFKKNDSRICISCSSQNNIKVYPKTLDIVHIYTHIYTYIYTQVYIYYIYISIYIERERDRQTERQTDTDRQTETKRDREYSVVDDHVERRKIMQQQFGVSLAQMNR